MQRFLLLKTLQKSTSVHVGVQNCSSLERHLIDRQTYQERRRRADSVASASQLRCRPQRSVCVCREETRPRKTNSSATPSCGSRSIGKKYHFIRTLGALNPRLMMRMMQADGLAGRGQAQPSNRYLTQGRARVTVQRISITDMQKSRKRVRATGCFSINACRFGQSARVRATRATPQR